ncbi:tetratricopeptide repeat protein [Rubrivirga sp.]|uniref:tetratricopeptide repeat protein n=1 Tax=Rubrivirga sp. TaxID=1885344 RepID=UPI003B529B9C
MSSPVPPPPEPVLLGAARLLAEGRPAEAAERLGALVAEAPTYAAAHVLRATALEAAGQIDDALVSWGRAAALVPRSPLVHRERERLLAARVAAEAPVGLPPAVPAPAAEHAEATDVPMDDDAEALLAEILGSTGGVPAPDLTALDAIQAADTSREPFDDEDDDGPLLHFGAPAPPAEPPTDEPPSLPEEPQTLDASDLVFSDVAGLPGAPPSTGPAGAPDPPGPEPTSEAPADPAPGSPVAADWDDETGLAAVVRPEGDLPPLAPAEATDGPDAGWDVVDEADVPTPPPGTYAEPDIVPPEEPSAPPPDVPPPSSGDPFADLDAVVDEFAAPPSAEPPGDRSVADELDALIAQLEDAPRIRPDPNYRGPEVSLDHGDVNDMASETLAKIYVAQHQYVEAAIVYETLAARQPDQADALLERAAELRQRGG